MAERDTSKPTHRVYTVIQRDGQDDYWLNIGLVFPHRDGNGFNIVLQASPLDGKLVCREVTEGDDSAAQPQQRGRQERGGATSRRR